MTEQPKRATFNALNILIALFVANIVFTLVVYISSQKYPCTYCFEYPEWWDIAFIAKQTIGLISATLLYKKFKIGFWGVLLVILVNAVISILFEYNILALFGYVGAIALLIKFYRDSKSTVEYK